MFQANIFGDLFRKLYDFFINLFSVLISWLGSFLNQLFQLLINFLKLLFKPIFILIAFIFYFIYKLGYVLILLFQVFLGIGKVLFSLVGGLFKTLAGFTYHPAPPGQTGSWSSLFSNIAQHGLSFFQLDIIAYLLMFIIWFGTGFMALKIISNLRAGG